MQWLRNASPLVNIPCKVPKARIWCRLNSNGYINIVDTASPTANGTGSNTSLSLRPYQESCLQACTSTLLEGKATRIGVSLPTGSGKTVVFVSLLSRLKPPPDNEQANRALIIVNSVELARQSAKQASEICPQWSVEIEQGVTFKASGSADVTVATYQTLLQPDRLAKFDAKFLKAIIVDEAHHAAAPSYRRILSHFDKDIRHPDEDFVPLETFHRIPIIGFSATFSRHDGLALGSVFQKIVYHRDFLEMIKEQWLCDVRFTSVRANINLKNVVINSRTGDFNPRSLAHVINTSTVNTLVVQAWLDRAAGRKSTLVFCVNIAHVRELTDKFREYGVDARYVYSGTPVNERKALVDAFKNGEFPILVNCAILTEGTDIPNIDCVVVARPTRSRNIFAQMIGRGMRLSLGTGKTDCHIVDFVESTSRVSGIVSTPTLFGLDPGEIIIENETLESLEQRSQDILKQEVAQKPDSLDEIPDPTSITYVDYDNPFSLVYSASGAPHINQLSQFAWVGCGNEIYVLECLGKGYIRVEFIEVITPQKTDSEQEDVAMASSDEGSFYKAVYTPALTDIVTAKIFNMSPFLRSRHVLTAKTLADAIKGCDTYATKKVIHGSMQLGLLRSAKWRQAPASESQKNLVAKRLNKGFSESRKPIDMKRLTKGQAANIITRLKNGAQLRYEKKIKAEQKIIKESLKEKMRRAREDVRVGSLVTE